MVPLLAFLSITACLPGSGSSDETTQPPSVVNTIPSSSAPEVGSTIQLEILEISLSGSPAAGNQALIGIFINNSGYAISNVSFNLIAVSSSSQPNLPIAGILGPPFMADGEIASFRVLVEDVDETDEIDIADVNARRAIFRGGDLEMSPVVEFVDETGRRSVLGLIENTAGAPVQISQISAIVRDEAGELADVGIPIAGPRVLEVDESLPFLVSFDQASDDESIELMSSSVLLNPGMELKINWIQEPELQFDTQGNPIVTGELTNKGESAKFVEVLFVLEKGGEIIGLHQFVTPISLPHSGRFAVAVGHFNGPPGGLKDLQDGGDGVDLWLSTKIFEGPDDPNPTEPVNLGFSLTGSEQIGSGWFLGGEIDGEEAQDFETFVVTASLRDFSGQIATAGWLAIDTEDGTENLNFVLRLPLPAGIDISLMEPDIRIFGLP